MLKGQKKKKKLSIKKKTEKENPPLSGMRNSPSAREKKTKRKRKKSFCFHVRTKRGFLTWSFLSYFSIAEA